LITAGFLCATALAGCSADLGRFDAANASLTQDAPRRQAALVPSEPMRRSNAGVPVEAEPPATPYSYNPAPQQPVAQSPSTVRLAGLPEPVTHEPEARRASEPPRRTSEPLRRDPAPIAPAKGSIANPAPAPVGGATTIEVQHGDTVYGLAKRHRVSISELMSANNLQTPMIRPGQKLVLPTAHRQSPARRTTKVASAPSSVLPTSAPSRVAAPSPAANAAAEAPAGWTGTHTVTPRDSLYAIAKRYNVKVAELQAANGISHPARLRAGTVLKVPGGGGVEVAAAPEAADPQAPVVPGSIRKPTIINGSEPAEPAPERVAVVAPPSPVMNDASPEPTTRPKAHAGVPGKFRWPAKGRVIASFGPRADKTQNDGINILVPQGTSVVAAESGVVAYAGSELKGYGNLVLIRHEGNWVSAYAHNESLLVKRGDKVERGQAIAKAGKTGAVDQPQVHFELRQGSKPVDPMPHLEK
jgi:murein DD-endopeptidase MepM/ murein hydrolase activator NlpD